MHTTVDDNPLRADNPSPLPYFPLFSLPQASVPQMTNSAINRVFQLTENIDSCSQIQYLCNSLYSQIHLTIYSTDIFDHINMANIKVYN